MTLAKLRRRGAGRHRDNKVASILLRSADPDGPFAWRGPQRRIHSHYSSLHSFRLIVRRMPMNSPRVIALTAALVTASAGAEAFDESKYPA